ncbi:MAG: DUF6301 family protein [Propionibacteriaceae bacterium]|jgi:hypothetical protein|nr:DUF6301 family protein [Propionibacteriaceae bacterium]
MAAVTPDLHIVTYEELKPVLDVLVGLPDHVPWVELSSIVDRLGWTLRTAGVGRTTLPVNLTMFMAGGMNMEDGSRELVSVDFLVSDTLYDGSKASWKRAVERAFPVMRDVVSRILGFEPTRERPWGLPGSTWDLPKPRGGQVDLLRGQSSLTVYVQAEWVTDLELAQIRHGRPFDDGLR